MGWRRQRCCIRAYAVAAVAITLLDSQAYAQRLRISQPANGNFGGILNTAVVGNTRVSQNFRGLSQPGSTRQPPSVLNSSTLTTFSGRRRGAGLDLVGQSAARARARRLNSTWLQTLSQGGAARYFRGSAPDYRLANTESNYAGARTARMLLSPRELLRTTAFAAPAHGAGVTSAYLQDPFWAQEGTQEALFSAGRFSESSEYSHADLMESRLAAVQKRLVKEGWQWYQRRDFQRAWASFSSADMLEGRDPEPRAGLFFCCLAEGKHYQAYRRMSDIFKRDADRNVFEDDYRLLERSEPPEEEDPARRGRIARGRLDAQLRQFMVFSQPRDGQSMSPAVLSTLTFAFWHYEGRQQEGQCHED